MPWKVLVFPFTCYISKTKHVATQSVGNCHRSLTLTDCLGTPVHFAMIISRPKNPPPINELTEFNSVESNVGTTVYSTNPLEVVSMSAANGATTRSVVLGRGKSGSWLYWGVSSPNEKYPFVETYE